MKVVAYDTLATGITGNSDDFWFGFSETSVLGSGPIIPLAFAAPD